MVAPLSPIQFGNVAHILGTKADINVLIRYEQRCVPTTAPDMALWKRDYPDDTRYEEALLISGADLKRAGLTPKTATSWDFAKALEFVTAQLTGKLTLGSPLRGTRMMVGKTPAGERAALYQYHPATANYTVPAAEKAKAEGEEAAPTDPSQPAKPTVDKRGRKKAPRRQSGHQRLKILGLLHDPLATDPLATETAQGS